MKNFPVRLLGALLCCVLLFSVAAADDIVAFRPVDCGIQSQNSYEYPFIGLTVKLPTSVLDQLDSRALFLFPLEDYASATAVSYAQLRLSAPTQAQQQEEGMSVDILAWEESLPKVGCIGVYQKELLGQLDSMTGCDTHKTIGESDDGAYAYVLSNSSAAGADLIAALEEAEITISEMRPLDLENGYTAFSAARIDGLTNIGNFTTEDVFGNVYDQSVFSQYDITLVNIFATWCSPCVREMPELEALRAQFESHGIKLGVVAVAMDTKTASGVDENALELARVLHERSGAQFPFLVPDETAFNGRLVGIAAYPETFFVDKNGNIVSEPYTGANTQEGWTEVVEAELAGLGGDIG